MEKVLHISKYYHPFTGGTEQTARDCVIALNGKYEQRVIAFNDSREDEQIEVDGVETVKCGTFAKISSQSLSTSYGKKLRLIMNKFQPDIIIFHYPNPFVAAILLGALKKYDARRAADSKKKTKLIIYWHLDIIRQKFLKVFFNPQNTKLLNRADRVIATSPNYIEGSAWLKSVKNKCVVVPSCINVERMRLTPEIEERAAKIREGNKGKIICVAVGRHTEYKGFTYLIQASKKLDSNFQFYIAGAGELTEILHGEADGDPRITFTGRIDDVDLKALIKACDIFCFPSITKNEAFGLALAEAMYYEKPAVTFTIPGSGVNYVCLDGVTGIEVENRNVDAYAEAIEKLARNKALRKEYGRAGKKRVTEKFLSTQFCENILCLINEVSGGGYSYVNIQTIFGISQKKPTVIFSFTHTVPEGMVE